MIAMCTSYDLRFFQDVQQLPTAQAYNTGKEIQARPKRKQVCRCVMQ